MLAPAPYPPTFRQGFFSETQRHKKSRGYADEPSEPQFVRKYACAPPTFSRRLVLHPRCRVATLARPVSFRGPLEGFMESNNLAWSGQSWRLPPWLWLGLAAMAVGTLHIPQRGNTFGPPPTKRILLKPPHQTPKGCEAALSHGPHERLSPSA